MIVASLMCKEAISRDVIDSAMTKQRYDNCQLGDAITASTVVNIYQLQLLLI